MGITFAFLVRQYSLIQEVHCKVHCRIRRNRKETRRVTSLRGGVKIVLMKKLSLYIYLVLIFFNFTSITKAKKIDVFCYLDREVFVKQNIYLLDIFRLSGNQLYFNIDLKENKIQDLSKNREVSVITGIKDSNEVKNITNKKSKIIYKSELFLKNKENKLEKYFYKNIFPIKSERPEKIIINIKRKFDITNEFKFEFQCKDSEYTNKDIANIIVEKSKSNRTIKYEDNSFNDSLLEKHKEKFFEKYKEGVKLRIKYYISIGKYEKNEIITAKKVKNWNAKQFFNLPAKDRKILKELKKIKKEYYSKHKKKIN